MINRVVLVGRLTKDVEVRKTQSQLSVASFTVAVDRRGARSQDQSSNQPTADFINCVAWRQTADFLGAYAKKGALVGVDGRLQTRTYDDAQGTKHYVTEVVCDNANILESKGASQQRAQSGTSFQQPSYSQPQPVENTGNSNDDFGAASLDISSDDLPF